MRQMTTPVPFERSTRMNKRSLVTSGRAGKVYPLADIMLLPGDSASGSITVEMQLAEMPKPLINQVFCNVQAWFVPWSVFPQFSGVDEFNAALTGESIKALGQADRAAPALFNTVAAGSLDLTELSNSEFALALGKHFPDKDVNTNAIDAFWQVYNFRLAAHSERLPLAKYASEDLTEALALPRAFWPSTRITRMVPDYDADLLVGAMDLDVTAGQMPVSGISRVGGNVANANANITPGAGFVNIYRDGGSNGLTFDINSGGISSIFAEMSGQTIVSSLADLDRARDTKSFARMYDAMRGANTSGFNNEDTLMALMMQGLSVPQEQFKRSWMLSSTRVPFLMNERHATDGASLSDSVSVGGVRVSLPINVPMNMSGGYIIVTGEILPERVDERAGDVAWHATGRDDLPNALRDVQRLEPVDAVPNWRIDTKHTTPDVQYAWEGMNDKWNSDVVAMGGDFYSPTAGAVNTASRQALWIPQLVDPAFTSSHYLAPASFPHNVFSVTAGDAYEAAVTHNVSIVGLTQIGDVLQEDNNAFDYVRAARVV